MILQIPVRSDFKAYKFTVDLEGVGYQLSFAFNARLDRWTMRILNDANEIILGDIPILSDVLINAQYLTIEGLPPGGFLPTNEEEPQVNAGIDDLGNSVPLYYLESAA